LSSYRRRVSALAANNAAVQSTKARTLALVHIAAAGAGAFSLDGYTLGGRRSPA
jgi:hypothetical protein